MNVLPMFYGFSDVLVGIRGRGILSLRVLFKFIRNMAPYQQF